MTAQVGEAEPAWMFGSSRVMGYQTWPPHETHANAVLLRLGLGGWGTLDAGLLW